MPSCALSPSNPAGSRPSGGLMQRDISQHAAWIPGNDKYQPQLCTTICRDSCSHQSRPLDVSQDPRMFCISQGTWTARVRRNMKWTGDILAPLSLLHSGVLWCNMQMGGLHREVRCRHMAVQSLQQMLLSFQNLSHTSVILCLNRGLCRISLISVNGNGQIWSCGVTRWGQRLVISRKEGVLGGGVQGNYSKDCVFTFPIICQCLCVCVCTL